MEEEKDKSTREETKSENEDGDEHNPVVMKTKNELRNEIMKLMKTKDQIER